MPDMARRLAPLLAVIGLISCDRSTVPADATLAPSPEATPVVVPVPVTLPAAVKGGSLVRSRLDSTATLLRDGRVLVVGGDRGGRPGEFPECGHESELYDPATGRAELSHPMKEPRSRHTATLLPDGRVLVVGGTNSSAVAAELYDGSGWSPAPGLADSGTYIDLTGEPAIRSSFARSGHTATLLGDGRVLVCGGLKSSTSSTMARAELFTPSTNSWTPTTPMTVARDDHTATRLQDGRLLVVGGRAFSGRTTGIDYIASVEAYQPETGQWETLPPLAQGRAHHATVRLQDGRVLTVGGLAQSTTEVDPAFGTPVSISLDSTEIFDPETNTWSAGLSLAEPRFYPTASVVADGTVVVTGGWSDMTNLASTELLAPSADRWVAGPPMSTPRDKHRAVALGDAVLLFGGQDDDHHSIARVDLVDLQPDARPNQGPATQGR